MLPLANFRNELKERKKDLRFHVNLVQADDYLHEMSNLNFFENHKVEITKFAVCCIYDWHFLVNFNKDFNQG